MGGATRAGKRRRGSAINLATYIGVLRRHRNLVVVGACLSVLLAFLSYVKISPSGFSYRTSEKWSNEATLALSQASQPELRSSLDETARPERFATLIDVYAAFATSDAVIAGLRAKGLLTEKDIENGKLPILATAVPSSANSGPTPLLKISATGKTPRDATKLTIGATNELMGFVTARQVIAAIPETERVELRLVKSSAEPTLIQPRSKSNLIVILLAGLTATVAAAFIRENARRGRPPQPARTAPAVAAGSPRKPPEVVIDLEQHDISESDAGDPRGIPASIVDVRGHETVGAAREAAFIDAVRDVCGLYLAPPERVVVVCADAQGEIQPPGGTASMLLDVSERTVNGNKRAGNSGLYGALTMTTGQALGALHARQRTLEFKSFLNAIDREVPTDLAVHVVVDSAATHTAPAIRRWLVAHPRFVLHFTSASASWLNLVERWLAEQNDKRPRRGAKSVVRELNSGIRAWIDAWDDDPSPFVWTKTTDEIVDSVARNYTAS